MRRISALAGLILGVVVLLGVRPCARAQHYIFDSYGQRAGLDNLAVQGLAFDHQGFLWIATENGVYRFLGTRFERYGKQQGVAERLVRDVFVDRAGRVWAATDENLYRWNGLRFEPLGDVPTPIGGAKRIAAPDRAHLLVIRREQLIEVSLDADGRALSERPFFTAEQVRHWPELARLTSVFVAANGTIWLGCGSSLCSSAHGNLRIWNRSDGVPRFDAGTDLWLGFTEDAKGSLWAASLRHIAQLAPQASRFAGRDAPGIELTGNTSNSPLLTDREGRVLRATDDGLARWDGATWRRFGQESGLPAGTRIMAAVLDAAGDLWLGSSSSGVHHWVGYGKWEGWTRKDGLPDESIWALAWQDPTHLLLGTEQGPAQLDTAAHRVTPMFASGKWAYGQVSGLEVDRRGAIWASTWTGKLLRIEPVSHHLTLAADLHTLSYASTTGPDGGLLLLTKKGIFAVDHPAAVSPVHPVEAANRLLPGNKHVIGACTTPGGDMWFLGLDGVLLLHLGQWSRPNLRGIQFAGSTPADISCGADGSVWLAGLDTEQQAGIWRIRTNTAPAADPIFQAVRIPTPAFLDSMDILSLLVDRRGYLWIGTDVGVVGTDGSVWRHFSQDEGLIWNDTNQAVMAEAPDGTIWIGTSGGAAHMLSPQSAFVPQSLSVTITSVERKDQVFLPGQQIALCWAHTPIRFNFASFGSGNPGVLEFRYRIPGLNPAWISTRDADATLPSVPPGTYRLEVQAHNRENGQFSAMAGVSFQILAPWWRTGWSIALYALAAGLLAWFFLWLRTHSLMTSQRRLEALVRDRTEELELSREALRVQAMHDPLTNLYNHGAILSLLDREMERTRREQARLAVLLLDLDHFKRVNDSHGHQAGDAVLRSFAEKLAASIRPYDFAGRYGGEEFLLLLSGLGEEDEISARLSSIHHRLTNLRVAVGDHEVRITCSIGVSFLEPGSVDRSAGELLLAADKALYEAKRAGRNRVIRSDRNIAEELACLVAMSCDPAAE